MASRPLFRSLLWIVPVFGVVWALMIFHWRATYRIPNTQDIVLYLVALPFGLVCSYAGLRYGIDAVKRHQRQAEESAHAKATDEQPPVVLADPSLAFTVSILASTVIFAAGDTEQALVDAAASQQKPELHPILRDSGGLPIAAAEITGIDIDTVDADHLSIHKLSEDRKRALWIAEFSVIQLLDEHFDTPFDGSRSDSQAPLLHIEWLLPDRWSEDERATAQQWLADRLALQDWIPPRVHLETRSVANSVQAFQRLDEINLKLNRDRSMVRYLVVASDSHLDMVVIDAWERNQHLRTHINPEGCIPGEGGCALLLGRLPDDHPTNTVARLHRILVGHRERPAEAAGRLSTEVLEELIEQARARAAIKASDIGFAISDGDLRPSRLREGMATVERAQPDVDLGQQNLALGMANGDSGAATSLAAVAVAAMLAREHQQAQLVFSIHDTHERAALVISPQPTVPSTQTAQVSLLS